MKLHEFPLQDVTADWSTDVGFSGGPESYVRVQRWKHTHTHTQTQRGLQIQLLLDHIHWRFSFPTGKRLDLTGELQDRVKINRSWLMFLLHAWTTCDLKSIWIQPQFSRLWLFRQKEPLLVPSCITKVSVLSGERHKMGSWQRHHREANEAIKQHLSAYICQF